MSYIICLRLHGQRLFLGDVDKVSVYFLAQLNQLCCFIIEPTTFCSFKVKLVTTDLQLESVPYKPSQITLKLGCNRAA